MLDADSGFFVFLPESLTAYPPLGCQTDLPSLLSQTLARRLSSYIHAFTLYSSVRPFGISTLLFGIDEVEGPQIYLIEPSGTYWGYKGAALGKARQLAKTEIEKLDLSELSLEDGVKEAAKM